MRCLAIAVSLAISLPLFSQESEYITAVGAIVNQDGSLDRGKSIKMAVDNLYEKVLEYCGYQVSSHTTLKNNNGKQDYKSTTAVDKGALIPSQEIELIPYEGFWVARIKKDKIKPQEVKWVEQNVTINNTYNEAPTYSRGYRRDVSTTRTTRRTDVIGPSGNVVKSTPGKGTTKKVRKNWDGRSGYTWTTTKKDKNND